jgi:putative transposase
MARRSRLVVAGLAHYVVLRGHSGAPVMTDAVDREAFLEALRQSAAPHQLVVHAWALLDNEVHLLLRPAQADALSRAMQTLGRRYVAAFNRRHGRSGTLWDGRFRAAVLEPGGTTLAALRRIDALGRELPLASSAWGRTGGVRPAALVDPPELWALGNTPFEREAAYGRLLAQEMPSAQAESLDAAARGGWACGSAAFLAQLAEQNARPVRPGPRGRPRKAVAKAAANPACRS